MADPVSGALIGSALIGGAGSLGSSALSLLSGHGQAYRSYKYSKLLQKNQFKLNQKALLENPAINRQGYENAGYNPLLAIGSTGLGFSANASQGINDTSREISNPVESALGAIESYNNAKQTKAQTNLINEQAETEKAKRIQMDFDNAETEIRTKIAKGEYNHQEERHAMDMLERFERVKSMRASSAISAMEAETHRQDVMNRYELGKESNAITDWNNKNKGYSSNFSFGPLTISHTGGPNKYTKFDNSNYHYETEYINGKPVKVKVYDWR